MTSESKTEAATLAALLTGMERLTNAVNEMKEDFKEMKEEISAIGGTILRAGEDRLSERPTTTTVSPNSKYHSDASPCIHQYVSSPTRTPPQSKRDHDLRQLPLEMLFPRNSAGESEEQDGGSAIPKSDTVKNIFNNTTADFWTLGGSQAMMNNDIFRDNLNMGEKNQTYQDNSAANVFSGQQNGYAVFGDENHENSDGVNAMDVSPAGSRIKSDTEQMSPLTSSLSSYSNTNQPDARKLTSVQKQHVHEWQNHTPPSPPTKGLREQDLELGRFCESDMTHTRPKAKKRKFLWSPPHSGDANRLSPIGEGNESPFRRTNSKGSPIIDNSFFRKLAGSWGKSFDFRSGMVGVQPGQQVGQAGAGKSLETAGLKLMSKSKIMDHNATDNSQKALVPALSFGQQSSTGNSDSGAAGPSKVPGSNNSQANQAQQNPIKAESNNNIVEKIQQTLFQDMRERSDNFKGKSFNKARLDDHEFATVVTDLLDHLATIHANGYFYDPCAAGGKEG
jgi:hypothetical protein